VGRTRPKSPTRFTRVTNREPVELTVSFAEGVPVALDGVNLKLADLIQILNAPSRARPVLDASTWWRTEGSASRVAKSTSVRAPSLYRGPLGFRGLVLERDRPSRKRGRLETPLVRVVYDGMWFSPLGKRRWTRHRRDPATREVGTWRLRFEAPGPTADRWSRSPKAL